MSAGMRDLSSDDLYRTTLAKRCSVDGCERAVHGRGWCKAHHQRVLDHGDPLALLPVRRYERSQCGVSSCRRRHYARGWCSTHYKRWLAHHDAMPSVPIGPSKQPPKRWPAVALLAEVGTHSELARVLGRQRMAASKWERVRLTTRQADEAAMALGLLPEFVWHDWLGGAA